MEIGRYSFKRPSWNLKCWQEAGKKKQLFNQWNRQKLLTFTAYIFCLISLLSMPLKTFGFIIHGAETSHLQLGNNTSELHIDDHTNGGSQEAGNIKSTFGPDYLRKVVVFQKPFHFHLPILSTKAAERSSQTDDDSVILDSNGVDKRAVVRKQVLPGQEATHSTATDKTSAKVIVGAAADATGLLLDKSRNSQNEKNDFHYSPKTIPSVNRKRSSGKQNNNMRHQFLDIMTTSPLSEDDFMGQGDQHTSLSNRNAKPVNFSQDLLDSILGHEDDLIAYRRKVMDQATALGIKPQDVFHSVVYGTPPNKNVTQTMTANDIYKRRLEFHRLFLDDSAESEKYQYNEVLEQDKKDSDRKRDPFDAHMKILKRSKRGLKSWFKKMFSRGSTTTTTTTTRAPKRVLKRNKQGKVILFRQRLDENGDSKVDLLLPKALRRSSYLKRRAQIKMLEEEEEEFEEEYEKSEEKEPTVRKLSDEYMQGDEYEGDSDYAQGKRKGSTKHDKQKYSSSFRSRRRERSSGDGNADETVILSKNEVSLIIEMIFNLIKYECANVKKTLMDGLLKFTNKIVGLSSLPDYIPERRKGVDLLFNQILDCSSNTETLSKWTQYQMRKRQQKSFSGGMKAYEMPLRRTKRVRREKLESVPDAATIDLISLITGSNLPQTKINETTKESEKTQEINEHQSLDSLKNLQKLYSLIYHMILDTCINVDKQIFYKSSLVFVEEMNKLQNSDDYNKELDNFAGHFDIEMASRILTECNYK